MTLLANWRLTNLQAKELNLHPGPVDGKSGMYMRLLNLERSTDRLALFRARNQNHAEIELVRAIDGKLANRQRLIDNAVMTPELSYSDGALGCALSHLVQWRDAIETNVALTIVEDDAVLCANFQEEATRIIASLPEDWEYIMWGYNFDAPLIYDLGTGLSPCSTTFDQKSLSRKIGEFTSQTMTTTALRLIWGFGTVCYSISPRGAARLLDFCMPLRPLETYHPGLRRKLQNTGIDNMLALVWPAMPAYVAVPPLVITENDQLTSTIRPIKALRQPATDTLQVDAFAKIFEQVGITDGVAIGIREDGEARLSTMALRRVGWRGFDIAVHPDKLVQALQERAAPEQFDLLHVGVASAGFHVLRTILVAFRPRVVVIAVNHALGAKDLVAPLSHLPMPDDAPSGASRLALSRLAARFGYTLHPCPEAEHYALLLREDVQCDGDEPWLEAGWSTQPQDEAAVGQGPAPDKAYAGFLTSEHYLLDGVSVAMTRHGRISYFENDRYIGHTFANGGYWDEATVTQIAAILREESGLVLDVGAHVGSHSVLLARSNPNLRFCCFEPQRPLFLLLERNIHENGLAGQIEAVWAAIGHRSGNFSLSSTLDEDGTRQALEYGGATKVNFGGAQLGSSGTPCALTRIDDLRLPRVCYVKLDVEGAEALALHGMTETLRSSMPIVFFEDREDRRLAQATLDALEVPAALRTLVPAEQLVALGYTVDALGIDYLAYPPRTAGSERSKQEIPRRIFQTWKSRTDLPENFAKWSQSFRNFNPCYEYVLYDDADNRAFIAEQFSWFLPVYDAYPQEIMRADVVRYFQLFAHGGFYADLDAECLRPLDHLLDAGDVVLGRMGPDPFHPHCIPNAMMASRPRQEFWLLVFWLLVLMSEQAGSVEEKTGPVLLKSAVDLWTAADPLLLPSALSAVRSWLSPEQCNVELTRRLTVLPPRRWYGLDWTDPMHQMVRLQVLGGAVLDASIKAALFGDADMVTYWAHSW